MFLERIKAFLLYFRGLFNLFSWPASIMILIVLVFLLVQGQSFPVSWQTVLVVCILHSFHSTFALVIMHRSEVRRLSKEDDLCMFLSGLTVYSITIWFLWPMIADVFSSSPAGLILHP